MADQNNEDRALSSQDTRHELLVAAAEMFATKGFENAGIREIAEQAGLSVSSVSYHFGNKDRLYVEAVQFVVQEYFLFNETSRIIYQTFENPLDASREIYAFFRSHMHKLLGPDSQPWAARLFYRAASAPTPDVAAIHTEILDATRRNLINVFLAHAPYATYLECWTAFKMLSSLVHNLSLTREVALPPLGMEHYSAKMIESVCEFAIPAILIRLGLPDPLISA